MTGKPKSISLALQGGGALGAYTWGALDRLLEDERIEIAAMFRQAPPAPEAQPLR